MVSKYTKQNLTKLQEEIERCTTIARDLKFFSVINRITIQKNNDLNDLINVINRFDIMNIHRTLYPTTTESTSFSSP